MQIIQRDWHKRWQRNWQRTTRGWWWRYLWRRGQRQGSDTGWLYHGRVVLKPIHHLKMVDWHKAAQHFRDPEISYLNGTAPNFMPPWLLKKMLKNDSKRKDRITFGIYDGMNYIGTIELYNITPMRATLGIIIGERTHWGKGYGTEAIHALLHYAFNNKGLEYICLNTYGDNLRAQRAFKKVGFIEQRRETVGRKRESIIMEMYASTYRTLLKQPPVWHSHHQ